MRGVLGLGSEDCNTAVILNRTVTWRASGEEYEAGPSFIRKVLKAMRMDECNVVTVLAQKKRWWRRTRCRSGGQLRAYRSAVARGNYLAQDRPDIRYPVKELCRSMSRPTNAEWSRHKKCADTLREALRGEKSGPHQGWRDRDVRGLRLGGIPNDRKVNQRRGHDGAWDVIEGLAHDAARGGRELRRSRVIRDHEGHDRRTRAPGDVQGHGRRVEGCRVYRQQRMSRDLPEDGSWYVEAHRGGGHGPRRP